MSCMPIPTRILGMFPSNDGRLISRFGENLNGMSQLIPTKNGLSLLFDWEVTIEWPSASHNSSAWAWPSRAYIVKYRETPFRNGFRPGEEEKPWSPRDRQSRELQLKNGSLTAIF